MARYQRDDRIQQTQRIDIAREVGAFGPSNMPAATARLGQMDGFVRRSVTHKCPSGARNVAAWQSGLLGDSLFWRRTSASIFTVFRFGLLESQ